jgi:hypothetical protein
MQTHLVRIRKSKSKLNLSHSSYHDHIPRISNSSSNFDIKTGINTITRSPVFEPFPETRKLKELCRKFAGSTETGGQDLKKTPSFEGLLLERIEKIGKAEMRSGSELQVIDSIYEEISNAFGNLKQILKILRQKLGECLSKNIEEEFNKELEGLKRSNMIFQAKMSNITKLNADLREENDMLKGKLQRYERLFEEDPDLLVKYENIVDKMLKQVQIIEVMKKEIMRLRSIKTENSEVLRDSKSRPSKVEDDYLIY